jgi:hypothetical protein
VSLFSIHVSTLSIQANKTEGVIEKYFKFEVRALVRFFFFASRRKESEIHRRLVSVYGQNFFNRNEVSVWCSTFKDGRMALNDDPENREADGGPRTLMKIQSSSKV